MLVNHGFRLKTCRNDGYRKPLVFLVACFLFPLSILRAADIAFDAVVDKTTVSMNDTVTLQISVSGSNISMPRPSLPPVPGFQIYSSGQSQNMSFVNGKASNQVVYSYALAPQAPGDYTIPALTLQAGDQTLSTKPIPIKVVSGSAPPPAASGGNPAAPTEVPRDRRDIFVVTSVDKKTAVVGEPVVLSFRFYSSPRAQLTAQPAYQPPSVNGFMTEDLPPQRNFRTTIDGTAYSVIELKTALFPTQPGKLTIGAAGLQCRVQDFSRGADPMQSFFDDFFSGGKVVTLRSDPISIRVDPLPEAGRPADFRGDVGEYKISAKLDRTSAQVHEPLTLTVTVSGEGNIKSLSTPAMPRLEGIKTYETVSSLNISKADYRVQGSKVFNTVIKPDVSGELVIPAISFSYYDPRAKSYRTAQSAPLKLKVSPSSAPDALEPSAPRGSLEGVKVVGQDIRFIKTHGRLRPQKPPLADTRFFLAMNLIPSLAFLALWAVRFRRARMSADSAGFSFRRAYGKADKARRQADRYLKSGDLPGYYAALNMVLMEYIGNKLMVPAQGLTWDYVEENLRRRSISDESLRAVKSLWDDFDRARFTPGLLNAAEAEKHGRELGILLKQLEGMWLK